MPEVTIPSAANPALPAHLALPDPGRSPAPWPGVVVVHDAFGVGQDMRDQAAWLAAAGFVTVVPDLYSRGGMRRCVQATFKALKNREGTAFDEIESARAWLADRDDCTGSVGVVGFCMGGGFALLLAPRQGWSAASVNYGTVPDDADTLLAQACPVVASFGKKDLSLRGAAAKVERALAGAGVPHDVKEYPDAGHGFLNRLGGPAPLRVLYKVAGFGYREGPAADARRRIAEFLDTHLRAPQA
jgi:carboxymethylenebutenolidase